MRGNCRIQAVAIHMMIDLKQVLNGISYVNDVDVSLENETLLSPTKHLVGSVRLSANLLTDVKARSFLLAYFLN